MKAEGLRAQVGYGSKPRHRGGPVGVVDNVLNREFAPDAPNKVWVTDITYIRTYEGWLYLAAVMDLYSRQIVGWATASAMPATWCCRPSWQQRGDASQVRASWCTPTRAASSPAATGNRS